MQFSMVDVASAFFIFKSLSERIQHPAKKKKKKKTLTSWDQHWQNIAGNHRIPWQKKIAFSYSDPGDTFENKLNDLKPLYTGRESLAFQKKFKKMLLPSRVILPTSQ